MRNFCKAIILSACTVFAINAGFGSPVLARFSSSDENLPSSDVLPTDFRGKITYSGNYSQTVTIVPRASSGRGSRTEASQGNLTYEVAYDGPNFKGNFSEPGGNFRTSGTFKGTRSGQTCQVEFSNGNYFTALCGRSRFSIVATFAGAWGRKTDVTVELKQAAFVDYAELDRERSVTDAKRWEQTSSTFNGGTTSTSKANSPNQRGQKLTTRALTPASAEELRLESLCNKSQWASCEPYARLKAPRLLKDCEAGSLESCYAYASAAKNNQVRQFDIWYVPKAQRAMKMTCEHWQTTTKEGWDYADRCGIRDVLERKARFDAIPSNITATTQQQRDLCVRSSGRVVGSERQKTGQIGQNAMGDVVDETVLVSIMEFTFTNLCKFPIKARCSSATFDVSNNIITLAPSQSTKSCQLLYVQ